MPPVSVGREDLANRDRYKEVTTSHDRKSVRIGTVASDGNSARRFLGEEQCAFLDTPIWGLYS